MKGLCDTTKKLAEKFRTPERPVKVERQIVGEEQQRKRWAERSEELPNRPASQNPPEIVPAAEDLDVESGTLSRTEKRNVNQTTADIEDRGTGRSPTGL